MLLSLYLRCMALSTPHITQLSIHRLFGRYPLLRPAGLCRGAGDPQNSPFTVAVSAKKELVYRHQRALQKGNHQYIPERYLELLTSKPQSIANAAPLRKGVMPKELKDFLGLCKARDKEQQLLKIMLLGRSVNPDSLLAAVDKANSSGAPPTR